tara:strand:+ start:255 stop:461 length:207 start_codon:yes stop_codon:yes gene_type:complete
VTQRQRKRRLADVLPVAMTQHKLELTAQLLQHAQTVHYPEQIPSAVQPFGGGKILRHRQRRSRNSCRV